MLESQVISQPDLQLPTADIWPQKQDIRCVSAMFSATDEHDPPKLYFLSVQTYRVKCQHLPIADIQSRQHDIRCVRPIVSAAYHHDPLPIGHELSHAGPV